MAIANNTAEDHGFNSRDIEEQQMAQEGAAAAKDQTAPEPDDSRKPDSPADIDKPSWKYTARSAWAEFKSDQCMDLAAALTYYSVLAMFPALLALVSLLSLFGQGEETVDQILELITSAGAATVPPEVQDAIRSMV